MNILAVTSHKMGSHYHRQLVPIEHLREHYNCTIVFCTVEKLFMTLDAMKWDIVMFSVFIPFPSEKVYDLIRLLQKNDTKVVFDIDDSWINGDEVYEDQVDTALIYSDLVTVTTERLKKDVLDYNSSVEVLPNAINPNHPQFKSEGLTTGGLTFGYLGSKNHRKDVELVDYHFSDNGKTCVVALEEYRALLGANIVTGLTDIYSYATAYNFIDVSIVPLRDSHFNSRKSELKLIEAGFKKKAVIVSNVPPYSDSELIEGCVTVEDSWVEVIESMTKDVAKELGERLYELVKDKYSIDNVNKDRYKAYKEIL